MAYNRVVEFFDEIDTSCREKNTLSKNTKIGKTSGLFVPSSLRHIEYIFSYLFGKKLLDRAKPFLDAGSGDGRVAVFAAACGFPSFGIEYDDELLQCSVRNACELRDFGILNGGKIDFACGDFTEDKPYHELGLDFKDVNLFFNYMNGHYSLAHKILEESPLGTLFILLYLNEKAPTFEEYSKYMAVQLKLEERIALPKDTSPMQIANDNMFAFMYRKARF